MSNRVVRALACRPKGPQPSGHHSAAVCSRGCRDVSRFVFARAGATKRAPGGCPGPFRVGCL